MAYLEVKVEPLSPSRTTSTTVAKPASAGCTARAASGAGDLPLYIIAACCGAGSSVQAGVNLSLARMLTGDNGENTLAAAFVSFLGGVVALVAINGGSVVAARCRGEPIELGRPNRWWELLGGVFGSTIMICTLLSTPHIGFALLSVMRIGGNMLTATVFDHVGFLGIAKRPMNRLKGIGLLLLLVGAVVGVWDDVMGDPLSEEGAGPDFDWRQIISTVGCCALAIIAGILLPVQVNSLVHCPGCTLNQLLHPCPSSRADILADYNLF